MVHEDYKELLALQALDALDETDKPDLTVHLSTCAECRAELDELRDVSGFLAYAATDVEPPVELRSRIMDSVRAEKSSTGATESSFERQPKSKVVPLTAPPRRSFGQRFGAIAAAIAIVALLGSLYVLWNRNKDLQGEVARLSRQAQDQQAEAERQSAAMALLTGPDATRLALNGS